MDIISKTICAPPRPGINDLRNGHLSRSKLARSSTTITGEYERGVSHLGRGLVAEHLETGLLFQERKEGYFSLDEHTEPLSLALSRQDTTLHEQVDPRPQLCDEIRIVSS